MHSLHSGTWYHNVYTHSLHSGTWYHERQKHRSSNGLTFGGELLDRGDYYTAEPCFSVSTVWAKRSSWHKKVGFHTGAFADKIRGNHICSSVFHIWLSFCERSIFNVLASHISHANDCVPELLCDVALFLPCKTNFCHDATIKVKIQNREIFSICPICHSIVDAFLYHCTDRLCYQLAFVYYEYIANM